MTAVAMEQVEPSKDPGPSLEQARVRKVRGRSLEVRLASGRTVQAELALGVPYRPLRGDEVLVIGDDRRYVIGVVAGRGRLDLAAEGLSLRALGRLTLSANQAIRLRAPKIHWLAEKTARFEVGTLLLQAAELRQDVGERLSVVTRDLDHVISRSWFAQADRACLKVVDAFHINGKVVRLG